MSRPYTPDTLAEEWDVDAPLRLSVAAKQAFPDGTMTAHGLRKEAARGRLIVERIAGKDYTTLSAIKRMRELCRVHPKAPGYISEKPDQEPKPTGLSSTPDTKRALAAASQIVSELSKH